jgi:hypothetical protein
MKAPSGCRESVLAQRNCQDTGKDEWSRMGNSSEDIEICPKSHLAHGHFCKYMIWDKWCSALLKRYFIPNNEFIEILSISSKLSLGLYRSFQAPTKEGL